ncbi:siderophore synthetase component [Halopolyspora algeriensis]|uniref:Siderophore synthetase component n=1 Tax=Halopolyspora algeriensis TaxID=1500506 RepID=A0A368VMZ9_9ACTN|nr:IucA/IucC family protein [Halopolyspora algeriensis]RCW42890.1 siderophore synthetase component [Halopolyspora algeriensis]TQM56641.1 siderophore synthetase component [Halopolyspora algeriensis]
MTAAPTAPIRTTDERSPEDMAGTAAVNGLLRCWIRENRVAVPESGPLLLQLPTSGTCLRTEVLYRSPAGFHRFGTTTLSTGTPVDAVTIATLLALEASAGRATADAVGDLVARVADSVRRVHLHLASRGRHGSEPAGTATPFLAAEQALVLGHPLHPAPKSRIGWTDTEAEWFSPELRASFALHWFAADSSIVSVSGDVAELLADFAPEVPEGAVAVPAHPWQARELYARPHIRRLLEADLLRDLGQSGPRWFPTASLRTVYHPHAPVMLKFSLGLAITNSKRENLRKELRRGAEIHRLFEAGLADELARAHPRFGVVRDPAWLAVDALGVEESGLELVVRSNPFGEHDTTAATGRTGCVAGLLAERPDLGRSELASLVEDLAERTGATTREIAEQWCARYFDEVIAPVLWLYETHGLGLEAHQQNTLVTLDADGWPCGGWYRDNQGYYLSERRIEALERFLLGVGEEGDNRCADAVIDERLGYYIGINNLLGVVGAFGSQGLADEQRLLAVFRDRLRNFPHLRLARTLADSATLRCKANLLTRVDGLDELVGPLETQSVYCDIANPLAEEAMLEAGENS